MSTNFMSYVVQIITMYSVGIMIHSCWSSSAQWFLVLLSLKGPMALRAFTTLTATAVWPAEIAYDAPIYNNAESIWLKFLHSLSYIPKLHWCRNHHVFSSLRKKRERENKLHGLYRWSDRPLLGKLVSTFADRGCRVLNAEDPYGRNLSS
jgi:hypothetical protein